MILESADIAGHPGNTDVGGIAILADIPWASPSTPCRVGALQFGPVLV